MMVHKHKHKQRETDVWSLSASAYCKEGVCGRVARDPSSTLKTSSSSFCCVSIKSNSLSSLNDDGGRGTYMKMESTNDTQERGREGGWEEERGEGRGMGVSKRERGRKGEQERERRGQG